MVIKKNMYKQVTNRKKSIVNIAYYNYTLMVYLYIYLWNSYL